MKIAICPADVAGCGYYRSWLPFTALARADGHELKVVDTPEDPVFFGTDLAVTQRISTPILLGWIGSFRQNRPGKRLIMDIDDNLRQLPSSNPAASVYGNQKIGTLNFEKAAREVDMLTVSNQELANVYADLNKEILICPNALDDELFHEFSKKAPTTEEVRKDGEFRIGYAGTATHVADFATVVKPLCAFMRKHPEAKLVLFGQDLRPLFHPEFWGRIEHVHGIAPNEQMVRRPSEAKDIFMRVYYEVLVKLQLDVAIAPLERYTFNKGKSYLKILEYGLAGVPAIATKFGPYAEYAHGHKSAVMVASEPREWVQALEHLLDGKNRKHLAD
ncbi:MAG: glycosyltransferase, partial [Patescibacteria group bacterium]|nr:glycosyltransferase [Patescibacteria group bacterium]